MDRQLVALSELLIGALLILRLFTGAAAGRVIRPAGSRSRGQGIRLVRAARGSQIASACVVRVVDRRAEPLTAP
jgi:hypothetical protein